MKSQIIIIKYSVFMSLFSLACLTASYLAAMFGFQGLIIGVFGALPIVGFLAWQGARQFSANIETRTALSTSIWTSILQVYPHLNTWRAFVRQFAHLLSVTAFITSSFLGLSTISVLISTTAYTFGNFALANLIQSYIHQIMQHSQFLLFPWLGLQIAAGGAVIWKNTRITYMAKKNLVEMTAGTDYRLAFHALDGLTSLAHHDGDLARADAYSIKLLDLASCA
jgi:hypothetical protein